MVKNATDGTTLTPAFTNCPTSGNAINAGISVIVPNPADTTVASTSDCFPTNSAMCSGGKIVKINPI